MFVLGAGQRTRFGTMHTLIWVSLSLCVGMGILLFRRGGDGPSCRLLFLLKKPDRSAPASQSLAGPRGVVAAGQAHDTVDAAHQR
jgi:hypothetical protein